MERVNPIVKNPHDLTLHPLEAEDRTKLIRFLESDEPVEGGPFVVDPKRLTLFLYETGMHPDVLAHSVRKKLHVAKNGNIRWIRAKKSIRSAGAEIDLKPHARIRDWYVEFLGSLPSIECRPTMVAMRKKVRGVWTTPLETDASSPNLGKPKVRAHCNCSQVYCRIVDQVGIAAGLPGFSARTCRHTFACRWYELTHDINIVMEKTGCTLAVALSYARLLRQKKWEAAGADMSDSPGEGGPSVPEQP